MLKASRSFVEQTESQSYSALCGLAVEPDGSGLRQIENRLETRMETGTGLEDASRLDQGKGVREVELTSHGPAGPGQMLGGLIE
jgi:hypothetical protein